jgi:hypothetical protein
MKRTFFLLTISLALVACSDKKREAELENRISDLETQLDDCKNGADKLLAKLKLAFDEEDFSQVKAIYSDLENRHPESEEFTTAKAINDEVLEIEEARRKEAEILAEKERQEKLKSLKRLKQELDDVSGITWYYNPYFTHYDNRNLTSIYMGEKEGSKPWLVLKMSYEGDDWIFFEKAYLSYDGNTMQIPFNKYDNKNTENGGGSVWEWIQVSITSDIENFLRDFAKSKDAKMRLSGKYTKTRNLTSNERKAILDVLNGYDALK